MAFIFLIVAFVLSLALSLIGLFVGNILVFECIGLGILTGALANNYLTIHPAFCVLIAFVVMFIFLLISITKVGFWIISVVMSFLFALFISAIVYGSTGKDRVWTYVSLGISFFIILGLHMGAKEKTSGKSSD